MLRFPQLTRMIWFRVLAIQHARDALTDEEHRLARFLTYQRIGQASGRIIGRRGCAAADGGMELADRYAAVHGLNAATFWADLQRLRRRGAVECVVRPAPGRRAQYALVLREEAIPSDLPEDLARALRTWDLPEPEDDAEDAQCGRLDAAPPQRVTLRELIRRNPATPSVEEAGRQAAAAHADLSAAPRWQHPDTSPAGHIAQTLRTASHGLPETERPDVRCTAVASAPTRHRLALRLAHRPETSPSYAKVFNPCGSFSTGSGGLRSMQTHGKAQRTPLRAAEIMGSLCGDDPRVMATRLLRRAWSRWRSELGRQRVLLPQLRIEDGSDELRRSARDQWDDLHRTIIIALRRSSPAEVSEVLHGSMASAEHVGRTAAARLWRLINSRRDAHGYRTPPRQPQLAPHAVAFDEATPAQRRMLASQPHHTPAPPPPPDATAMRERLRAENEQRRAEAEEQHQLEEARRAELFRRWGLPVAPRELKEPEHVHQDQHQPETPQRTPDQIRAAARARARAAKGRRSQPAEEPSARARELAERLLRHRQHPTD